MVGGELQLTSYPVGLQFPEVHFFVIAHDPVLELFYLAFHLDAQSALHASEELEAIDKFCHGVLRLADAR